MITVLCGGVGAARFLRALSGVVASSDVTAVINTGDDTILHGLRISPDLDTITYTLAGAIDVERGWGLRNETWRTMESLGRFTGVRPAGSNAAPTWFNLGDQDLATHFYRTARLAEGASLTSATTEIAAAWGVEQVLLPMTNETVYTRLQLVEPIDGTDDISFQEYFVKHRHSVAIRDVRFVGPVERGPSRPVARSIGEADVVVIAPSNPIVSIGPIRALAGVDGLLAARRESVIAISPIVGGAALKGPADRMLVELGHEPSVIGVARLYAPIAAALVIDPADAHLAPEVEAEGIRAIVTPSVMSTVEAGQSLARRTLEAAGLTA